MELKKRERAELLEALKSAIRTPESLEEFVWTNLETTMAQVTVPAVLSVMIIQTIEWASSHSKVEDLLAGAIEMFHDNLLVSRDLPPLLETFRHRRQQETTRATIHRVQAIEELPTLLNNLKQLVETLQQMSPTTDPQASRHALEAGRRAIYRVSAGDEIPELTSEEQTGIEAIVLASSRPALLVQNGDFSQPPEPWAILEKHRAAIRRVIAATGRIETPGGPNPWIGTGTLIASNIIAVPDYMVSMFAEQRGGHWKLKGKDSVRIDFHKEYGSSVADAPAVVDIIGTNADLGIALLYVDAAASHRLPLPLAATPDIAPERKVFLVGYPSRDTRRPDDFMQLALAGVLDVKRLCPGLILKPAVGMLARREGTVIAHDCMSSAGMGGAPLVDLETGKAVGLHFAAQYQVAGYARPFSMLEGTSLSRDAGLAFV